MKVTYDMLPAINIRIVTNDLVGAIIKLSNARGNNAGVNNDTAGELRFLSNDSAKNLHSFGSMKVVSTEVTDESEIGKMTLGVACSDTGGVNDIITITGGTDTSTSNTDIGGSITVAEAATFGSSITSGNFSSNIRYNDDVPIVSMKGKMPIIILPNGTAWMGSLPPSSDTVISLRWPSGSLTHTEVASSYDKFWQIPGITNAVASSSDGGNSNCCIIINW